MHTSPTAISKSFSARLLLIRLWALLMDADNQLVEMDESWFSEASQI